jgi:hypothetical protein
MIKLLASFLCLFLEGTLTPNNCFYQCYVISSTCRFVNSHFYDRMKAIRGIFYLGGKSLSKQP